MRKALILLVVFAVVGAAAFADGTAKWAISTNFGFGITSVGSATDLTAFDWAKEGNYRTRFGFTYTSADGNAGFNSRLEMTTYIPATPPFAAGWIAEFNQLNAWAKLFGGMLTVRAGMLDDYTVSTQDWNDFGNTDGKVGISFNVAPIPGLDIAFFQVIPTAGAVAIANFTDGDKIGAKFAIKDIGDLAAGVTLLSTATATTGNAIYFGFNLKAIPGLTALVEGQATLASGATPIQIDENIAYAMGALTVGARIGEVLNGSTFDWGIEPSVGYKVSDNLSINAIANVYSAASNDSLIWSSGALYAGTAGGGLNGGVAAGTIGFGAGASISWAASGFTVVVGDYFSAAAAPNGGNIFYVNADISL